uniref:Uncharacterized protein n=1 Tax=Zea mays TaxID=4577 RepID=A0A804NMN6_MAIZE
MAPASSSRAARDPLLFARFDLPAGWGCRKSLAFCREAQDMDDAPQAPAAGEVAQEAPRKQWNLRERTSWRDYSNRADDLRARQARKLGSMDAGGNRRLSLSVKLTRQEIDADFTKITGSKVPRRPTKRSKTVQRKIEVRGLTETLLPGEFAGVGDPRPVQEAAKATTETVDALRTGAAAMKAMQKATNIDDVDKTMDEINE